MRPVVTVYIVKRCTILFDLYKTKFSKFPPIGRSDGILGYTTFAAVQLYANGNSDDDIDTGRHRDACDGCPLSIRLPERRQ